MEDCRVKKRVLICQGTIPAYRHPVFNELARHYDLTILHAGRKEAHEGAAYREIIVPARQMVGLKWQSFARVWRHMREHDVVIAMFDLHWPAYVLPVLLPLRRRFIFWGGWYGPRCVANMARTMLARRADANLLYGDKEIEQLVARGVPLEKIHVAWNTVANALARDTSEAAKNSFLFVGRLLGGNRRSSKRVDVLLQSFARVADRLPKNIVLDIVGDGDEALDLRKLAEHLGITGKVFFHGALFREEDLDPLFERALALVSPGHVGLNVLQAFSWGVPVVTGRSISRSGLAHHLHNLLTGQDVIMGPEYYNIYHMKNGILVETAKELDEALVRLANDSQFRRKLARKAWEHYSGSRTVEHMVAGFINAIECR